MTDRQGFAVSLVVLDGLDLCSFYETEMRARLLGMAVQSEAEPFTLAQALSSGALTFGSRVVPVRQVLVPLARMAQSDPRILERLTGFINDCAIMALPSFEKDWPNDDRPRQAIVATQEMLSGRRDKASWSEIARLGLVAWAGWLAPKGLVASAEWVAWDHRSSSRRLSFEKDATPFEVWQSWAEWAAFNVLIYLGKNYKSRKTKGELDQENNAEHLWALERLALWLEPEGPEPLPLPELPKQGPAKRDGQRCTARFVETYPDMEWPHMAVFPEGLERIGRIDLQRNAVMRVPDGVRSIDEIKVYDHPEIDLPASLQKIGKLRAYHDVHIDLPEGIREIDHIHLERECSVTLPSTIEYVGRINTEAESYLWEVGIEDDESEEDYWREIEEQENKCDPDGRKDCFVICKGQYLVRGRKNIRFHEGGKVRSAERWNIEPSDYEWYKQDDS